MNRAIQLAWLLVAIAAVAEFHAWRVVDSEPADTVAAQCSNTAI